MRVTEARDVYAEQLELRGGSPRRASRRSRRVSGRRPPQPSRNPVPPARTPARRRRHLTDRVDVRVGRAAGRCRRRRPRARLRGRPAARANSSRGRTPAENTSSSASMRWPSARVTRDPTASARPTAATAAPQCTADPRRDQVGEHRAAALIDLQRHQLRRDLHHVRRQPQQPERVGGLEPEQPAADHDTAARAGSRRPRGSPQGHRWCGRRSSQPRPCPGSAGRMDTIRWRAPARRSRSAPLRTW